MDSKKNSKPMHFSTVYLHSVPAGRRGKHNEIVGKILEDLESLQDGTALRIPLESFGSQKLANVRAAVSRATKKRKMNIESATDGRYFFLWFSENGRGKKTSAKD
jgi:hypothetical protein